MSPPIPTTKDLAAAIVAAIKASLNQFATLLFKAFIIVLGDALSGVLVTLYKYSNYIFLQLFVVTAALDEITVNGRKINPLIFWGRLVGAGDPVAPTSAEHEIDVTVVTQGGTLKAGETQVIGSPNGYTYTLTADLLLNSDVVTGTFRASNDPDNTGGAGAGGNLTVGDIATFATPYGDVEPDAVVSARTADGADGESADAYRNRVARRFGGRPQGGAGLDYVYWALEEAGIINVYVYKGDPGEVDVYSEATPASSGNPDGIPTVAQLDGVKALIELDSGGLAFRRPVGSFVNSLPISRSGFTVDVLDLTGEDLPALKIAISDAIETFLFEREPYVDGVTPLPRKQDINRDDITTIVRDYAAAANGTFASVVVKFTVSGLAFSVYTLAEGEKAKLTIVNYLTS